MSNKQARPASDMLGMIADRNEQVQTIAEAQFNKRRVEEAIIKRLLRDNDHRYFSVAWRKLERDVIDNRS